MQSIQTKFLSATDTRGSRIKAIAERGSITIPFPYDKSGDECHREAAHRLIAKFCESDLKCYGTPIESNPWNRPFVTGCLPDNSYAHVFSI